jgi:hypothetical protein
MYSQIKATLGGGGGVLLFPIFETARLSFAHIALNREKYQLGESS